MFEAVTLCPWCDVYIETNNTHTNTNDINSNNNTNTNNTNTDTDTANTTTTNNNIVNDNKSFRWESLNGEPSLKIA